MIRVYSRPLETPLERGSRERVMPWEFFRRSYVMTVDVSGGLTVSEGDFWPERCTSIGSESLQSIQEVLAPYLTGEPRVPTVNMLEAPFTGKDDWRPQGSLIELSFGAKGANLQLLWDGKAKLPDDLDQAIIATMDLVCDRSHLAKSYLSRSLPEEVSSRLECLGAD